MRILQGVRRECPTGVDMARMKIEVLRARVEKNGLSLHDRLVGYLPRYAPIAARLHWLFNLRDVVPGAARLSEAIASFSARRSLPKWRVDYFKDVDARPEAGRDGKEVVLFADTFNRYFERENIDAALTRARRGRLLDQCREAERRRPTLVLRPDVPFDRKNGRGASGSGAHARCACAIC